MLQVDEALDPGVVDSPVNHHTFVIIILDLVLVDDRFTFDDGHILQRVRNKWRSIGSN